MIYRLPMPQLEGVDEMRILQWHKAEGDSVTADHLLVEVETDKAIIEVRAARACVLRKIVTDTGSWSASSAPLAWFSDSVDEELRTDQAEDLSATYEAT
jgi:pyruvate/2-oxoglutarate dehydrogenase complex dihydrolipoamide acyltransferase (E2) component